MPAAYSNRHPGPLIVVPGGAGLMFLYRNQGGLLPDLICVMTKEQFEKQYRPK